MTTEVQNRITTAPVPSKPTRLIFSVVVAVYVVVVALLFVLARESGWTLGKTYLSLSAVFVAFLMVCLLIWNPVLIKRRMFAPRGKTWDIVLMVMLVAIMIAMVVVAREDLNARVGDPILLGTTWLTGLCIFVAGWIILIWSMVSNPFFEKSVRIQTNHGHHVIDRGPYAYIRHPGYIGFSALSLSTPLLLASAVTFLPALLLVLGFVIRTVFEDRTLQAELSGYKEYTDRVRFRLVPGVW